MKTELDEVKKETAQCSCGEDEESLYPGLDVVIDGFIGVPGALIPVLQSAQNIFEYLPEKALKHISRRMKIPYSEVTGVVTFYSYFSTVPRGKHIIRVCLGTSCYVRGGKAVLEAIQNKLSIPVGGTTVDRMFSLEVGRCFGACGLAPTISIDGKVYKRVKPTKVGEILEPFYAEAEAEVNAETGTNMETGTTAYAQSEVV
ncbi:MAG: NAD(P)H-dependent oxidoreductase subunit E [Spirochaetia bacterium]|jgi:NADH:ubiquinone oxidoreductase subunit E|nr:NAD(P)H-dependent oxidoreductase subunit E [Spirochaetia bacterium]